MKAKNIIAFLIMIAIIVSICYVTAFDVTIGDWRFPSALDETYGIKKGLDLVGGSVIVFEPAEDITPSGEDLTTVEQILRTRLDNENYFDATISRQGNGVRVEIPNIDDPNKAVELLGATAKLTFRDADGQVVMEGTDKYIKNATGTYGQISENSPSQYYVALELTDEGRKVFAEQTDRISKLGEGKNTIGIYLDETQVSAPRVSERIDSSNCVISGNFTKESADTLANQIRSGQLPFNLKEVEVRSVGPTLGEEALTTSLIAGGIGVLLIMIFMLIMYRFAGLVADISLLAYIGMFSIAMVSTKATLTLPGIAGVILSIGMAVDANVVIFERMKEELNTGKTIGAAIDTAFNRALTAIIDANITTIIAAVVLFFLGTGPVKGFALTLLMGTIISMITAIFITKFNMKNIVKGFGLKNPVWFGKRRVKASENV